MLPLHASLTACRIPANGELSLMNNKLQGLERDLEVECRKLREMQDAARERDKEYQKLKVSTIRYPYLGIFL